MENRSLSLAASLIVLALGASPVVATDKIDPALQQDWQDRLARANALQAEARQRQAEAARVQAGKDAECTHVFLVNRCRAENQAEFTEASRAARRLENEGKVIERQVRKEQQSEHDRLQREEAPRRAAELPAREAETTAARAEAEARETRIRADKERQAQEGAKRKAEAAAKHQQKVADHAARVEKQRQRHERQVEAGK